MIADDGHLLEPVAIVGMGCRLPGGVGSPDELWQLLRDNRDGIGEVPPQRWQPYVDRGPQYAMAVRRAIRSGGYLADIAGFDADFFGISPREAELMDPQQRVTMEVAWETLEHAGIAPSSLAGSDASVFMGVCCDDYGRRLLEDLPRLEAWTGIGSSMCAVANRVSHALDLRGPSVTIDTACSASLVAVHQACQALRAGETSLALAGGVMLVTSPSFAIVLGAAGALSPDGTSKAFDAGANGYVRSEGCAVLALKRLADAQRDGDRVLAVVRGSAVCQDGRTDGIMAPSQPAQAHLMRQACRAAGVRPDSIDYVEAHGTGTGVGDPIEAGALAATVGVGRPPERPCLIGSIKSNIGHLEAASGVAGVIKLVLALRHEQIPATLSRDGLNPKIPWAESGLRVVTENTPWPRTAGRPRRGGVGNYGYGGTLAHVIVEEPPAASRDARDGDATDCGGVRVFPLSGASQPGLRAYAGRLATWLRTDRDTPLDAVGHTLALRRTALPVRACVVAADRAELAERLDQFASGGAADGVISASSRRGVTGPVWVFSGHGAQWPGMAVDLLDTEPLLGRTLDELDEIYRTELGISPRQVLREGRLDDVAEIQAVTFAVQVGLSRIWRRYGIVPAAIIGHSVGEIAASVAAGMLDLTDAARLICRRSRLLRRVAGTGAMVMVDLPYPEAVEWLAGEDAVWPAIAASPTSTVLSGEAAAVARVAAELAAAGRSTRRVDTDVAFHSGHMDALIPELLAGTADLAPRSGTVPTYTTALEDPRAQPHRDAAYWAANLRNPVRFAAAVAAAIDDGHRIFLEVSTHPVVAHSILETLACHGVDDGVAVGTLKRKQPGPSTLRHQLATLHCHGVPVDWAALYPRRELADLPTTAWQHRRYWAAPAPHQHSGHDPDRHILLGQRVRVQGGEPTSLWLTRVDELTRPYPGRHRVLGAEIVPAAVVLTTFLAAADSTAAAADSTAATADSAATAAGSGRPGLREVALRVPVALTTTRDLQVVSRASTLQLSTRLTDQDTDDAWVSHATAQISDVPADQHAGPAVLTDADGDLLDPGCVMQRLHDIEVDGIGFPWQVRQVRRTATQLVVWIVADPQQTMPVNSWASLFDAALSAAPVLFPDPPLLRMPAELETVTVVGDAPAEACVVIRLVEVQWSDQRAEQIEVDLVIADAADQRVAARMTGVRFAVVPQAVLTPPEPDESAQPPDQDWRDLPPAERYQQVELAVRRVVADELRCAPDDLDGHRPLSDLGVDSLLRELIRQRLSRRFATALPSGILWDRPSVAAVAGYLAESATPEGDR